MITVILNGEEKDLKPETNLRQAIELWGLEENAFALAINSEFVPKSFYDNTTLNSGDQVELLVPMQGG